MGSNNTDMAMSDVERQLLEDARDDYVGLWAFVWSARELMGVGDADRRRHITMEMVSRMLKRGLIRAGKPTRNFSSFVPWEGSAEEVIARIEGEWTKLGREPSLYEVVWFETTDEGEEVVARYSPEDSGLTLESVE